MTGNKNSGTVGGPVIQAGRIGDVHISHLPNVPKANDPAEFVRAVTVVGVLLGLTSSSSPAGAVAAAEPPVGVTATPSPITTLAPTSVTSAPVVAVTSQPAAESRSTPSTTTPVAAPTAEPDHRHTSAPDLTGAWELDLTPAGADSPDRYTITLKRLGDSKCGGNPPCYGGQWFRNGVAGTNGVVMWASPAPIGFTALDGDQTYRGTVVEDDTRRPLSYQGTWIANGGLHATFVFTRVA